MRTLLVIHFMMGPLMLVIGLLTKIFPPRSINWFYGYRTRRSMQSQEAWFEGNRYSTNALVILGLCVSLSQLVTFWLFDQDTSLLISAGVLVAGLLFTIFLTERHLKSKGYN